MIGPLQAIALLVRLFAIWMLIHLMDAFVRQVTALSGNDGFSIGYVLVTVFVFFFTFNLYRSPLWVARLLLRDLDIGKIDPQPMSPQGWFPVGRCLLGLWFVGNGLPEVVSTLLLMLNVSKDTNGIPHLLGAIFTCVCGGILLMGWPKMKGTLSTVQKHN